jgi:hypothetical protein
VQNLFLQRKLFSVSLAKEMLPSRLATHLGLFRDLRLDIVRIELALELDAEIVRVFDVLFDRTQHHVIRLTVCSDFVSCCNEIKVLITVPGANYSLLLTIEFIKRLNVKHESEVIELHIKFFVGVHSLQVAFQACQTHDIGCSVAWLRADKDTKCK